MFECDNVPLRQKPVRATVYHIQCNVSEKINNGQVRFLGTRPDTRRPWGRGCNTSISLDLLSGHFRQFHEDV